MVVIAANLIKGKLIAYGTATHTQTHARIKLTFLTFKTANPSILMSNRQTTKENNLDTKKTRRPGFHSTQIKLNELIN